MSVTVLEIIQGISQALSNKHDGATDPDGKPIEIGLRREEDVPHTERRTMDGFGVNIAGNVLRLNYHSEISIKEVAAKGFEQDMIDIMESCISHIKKEYKSITKKTLGLKKVGDHVVDVNHMNKFRSWVQAHCLYELSDIPAEEKLADNWKDRLDKSFKDYVDLDSDKD